LNTPRSFIPKGEGTKLPNCSKNGAPEKSFTISGYHGGQRENIKKKKTKKNKKRKKENKNKTYSQQLLHHDPRQES
jgi:hypothetical protein